MMAMAMAMATVGPMGVLFVSASESESWGGMGGFYGVEKRIS